MKWKTGISTAYWIDSSDRVEREAQLCLGVGAEGKEHPQTVSWFDELFLGGIQVFNGQHPVTLLLKGPPGDGKTTLALELCYRLAEKDRITSTYISLESESKQITANMEKFGWVKEREDKDEKDENKDKNTFFNEITPQTPTKTSFLNVCGSEHTTQWSKKLSLKYINKRANRVNIVLETVANLCRIPYSSSLKEEIQRFIAKKSTEKVKKDIKAQTNGSDILVIDSLNIIPLESRTQVFLELLKIAKQPQNSIKLLIFILDGKSSNDKNPFWEYMCDTIIELNHHTENDYLIKTIEIVKSRFQQHILGRHQMKIYGKPADQRNEHIDETTLSRLHPRIKEGGIIIFPSIHFYLTKYNKFVQAGSLKYDATFPKPFMDFLSKPDLNAGGFPKGRCTALIGCRSGHKSHLAYVHILSRLTGKYVNGKNSDINKNAALVVSLRDDEKMITSTLDGILGIEFKDQKDQEDKKDKKDQEDQEGWTANKLIQENRLEILYYPPGYISPEEFIHRIFVSIHKLKDRVRTTEKGENKEGDVTVVFNSLDQLAARFPLCAKLDIFIPSIIQILIGEGITSIFIAVDEKDQPVEQYGLLPMADLILSCHKYRVTGDEYNTINIHAKPRASTGEQREEIILTIERFAGGKRAGAKGLLELKTKLNFFDLQDKVYLDKDLKIN